jgi:hypothetical protein
MITLIRCRRSISGLGIVRYWEFGLLEPKGNQGYQSETSPTGALQTIHIPFLVLILNVNTVFISSSGQDELKQMPLGYIIQKYLVEIGISDLSPTNQR